MNIRTYARPCTGLGVLVGVGVGVGVERRGRALTCTGVIHGSLRVSETTEEPSSTETDATCAR